MTQASKIIPLNVVAGNSAEADDQNEKLLDFVAIMVHDLQGPFVSMKTVLKLLQKGRFNPENNHHRELLNSSVLAFNRAESIIHDLIDSAKAGRVGFQIELDFADVDELVSESANMLKASAEEYEVNIIVNPGANAKAQIDKEYFLRIVDNLIFNAIKHSTRGGKIYVETAVSGEQIEVTVSDEGSGLEGINLDDLFDQYKQMDLRKEGKFRGVGLGLYFCRLAVEAMGGKIWAETNSIGGASFKISLIKDRRRG